MPTAARAWVIAIAAGAALAAGIASAAAAPVAAHQGRPVVTGHRKSGSVKVSPDFSCQPGYICIFSSDSWTGTAVSIEANSYKGPPWYEWGQAGWTLSQNPGSLTNNSGSAVWVYSVAHDADPSCYSGNERLKAVLNHDYGWFYVTYGQPACGNDPPTPLPTARPQISKHHSAQPDFTCPGATVCVFPNENETGNYGAPWDGPAKLGIDAYTNYWFSFASASITPNPGSLNNNYSEDCTWVYDKAAGPSSNNPHPVNADAKYNLDNSYGYIYIQTGYSQCPANPPTPLP
jgi:hypothetical protein